MEDNEIYIIGAGSYGEVMLELAEMVGFSVKAFFDEEDSKIGKKVNGKNVIGKFSKLKNNEIVNKRFIVAIGNNEVRSRLMKKINDLGGETPKIIHPTAIISPTAKIGIGVYIQAGAILWTKVKIKDYSIISPGVVIAHHSIIGKGCLISTMSSIGASIELKDKVFVGMGATIVTGLNFVGENSTIGAGAVVLRDVERDSVYVGVPAKKLKNKY